MNRLKIGFIGLGQRGGGLIDSILSCIPEVDIYAICDLYQDRVDDIANRVKKKRNFDVLKFSDYHQLIKCGVDIIIVSCSWEGHIPIAIDCLKAGICTGMEVGGAYSVEECFKLVETCECTKTPFMFLENCCYDKQELMVTSMVRKGMLGEIVHCSGAYSHDLRQEVTKGNIIRHYRLRNYLNRNCENYPTHELGPLAKILNINRGNRMVKLVSVASKSRGMQSFIDCASDDKTDKSLKGREFLQGDVVNTIITCADGATISLKLDTSLPGFYDRELLVQGTKGRYNGSCNYAVIDDEKEDGEKESYIGIENNLKHINQAVKYEKDNLPDYWLNLSESEKNSGHGGMDVLMLKQFFKHYKNHEEMPIDCYDGASWMAISALSEQSIQQGGAVVTIPDFTGGKWILRKPIDVM